MKDFLDKVVDKKYNELEPYIASRTAELLRNEIETRKSEFVAKVAGKQEG